MLLHSEHCSYLVEDQHSCRTGFQFGGQVLHKGYDTGVRADQLTLSVDNKEKQVALSCDSPG
jgi:hypothetical protein